MARDVSTLKIELTAEDKASGVIAGVGNVIKSGLVAAVGVATAALGSLALAMRSAIPAAIEQEDAIKRLSNALADLGPAGAHVVSALSDQAAALQKTTRYSDEAINAGQAFAAAFVKSEDALKGVTQSAVDLAAGLGIDLQTAFELLTKASQGNTATLSRYGLVLDENIPKGEKLAAVQQLIAERFGGRAQADAKTYSGALAQLGNAWGEVLEAIGNAVIQNDGIIASMKGLTASLFAVVPQVAEFAKTIIDLGVSAAPVAIKSLQALGAFLLTFALTASLAAEGVIKLGRGLLFLASLVPGVGSALSGMSETLKDMDDSIDPFQQKTAKLAGELGSAVLGLHDFSIAGAEAAEKSASAARGVGALADAAERTGPAFTTYRTAAQLAAQATDAAGVSAESYSDALVSQVVPALTQAIEKIAMASRAFDELSAAQGRNAAVSAALANGGTLSMGGTRVDLAGGGSRLTSAPGIGGTYGSQTRVSYSDSVAYIYNPATGRIEKY